MSSCTSAVATGLLAGVALGYTACYYLLTGSLDGITSLPTGDGAKAVKKGETAERTWGERPGEGTPPCMRFFLFPTRSPLPPPPTHAVAPASRPARSAPADPEVPKMVLVVRRDLAMVSCEWERRQRGGQPTRGVFFQPAAPSPPRSLCLSDPLLLFQGRGKTAAQACHACLGLYKKLRHRKEPIVKVWEASGATKVCLRVESEAELLALQKAAAAAGVPTHMVVDAGRTQVAPDSRTVLALLAEGGDVDAVTGGLKLL